MSLWQRQEIQEVLRRLSAWLIAPALYLARAAQQRQAQLAVQHLAKFVAQHRVKLALGAAR